MNSTAESGRNTRVLSRRSAHEVAFLGGCRRGTTCLSLRGRCGPEGDSANLNLPELKMLRKRNDGVHGLRFAVTHNPEEHNFFFSAQVRDGLLSLNINECHPFYSSAYRQLTSERLSRKTERIRSSTCYCCSFLVRGRNASPKPLPRP